MKDPSLLVSPVKCLCRNLKFWDTEWELWKSVLQQVPVDGYRFLTFINVAVLRWFSLQFGWIYFPLLWTVRVALYSSDHFIIELNWMKALFQLLYTIHILQFYNDSLSTNRLVFLVSHLWISVPTIWYPTLLQHVCTMEWKVFRSALTHQQWTSIHEQGSSG